MIVGAWSVKSVAAPLDNEADFIKWRDWFRENEGVLWASDTKALSYRIRDKARDLAKPFAQANPLIEYDAWVDNCTDNVLIKTYHRIGDREIGCCVSILRSELRDHGVTKTTLSNVAPLIDTKLAVLTEATNHVMAGGKFPAEWKGDTVMSLAQAKMTGGYIAVRV